MLLRKVTIALEDGDFETVMTEVKTGDDGNLLRSKPQSKRDRAPSDDQKTALKAISRAIVERPGKPSTAPDLPKGECTTESAAVDLIARLLPRNQQKRQ